MKTRQQDNFRKPLNGVLDLTVIDAKTKEVIAEHTKRNLIVNTGYAAAAKALAGQAAINYVKIGTNATLPTMDDTAITDAETLPITSFEFPEFAVRFNFRIDALTANGMDIVEFGLITSSGDLFSRLVRPEVISKTNEIEILGSWQINL